MKKILLTGGSGFIGRNLRESFLSGKYEICAPTHAQLDLTDTRAADEFFAKNSFDCVLHAGVKPGHRNAKDKSDLLYSNLRMFENLERNRGSFGKLLNFGSGAVYDQSADITAALESEIFARMPADEHGFCKYTVEKILRNTPDFTDLIIFGIFGKYEDWEIRFISNAVCKAVHGLPITLRQNRRFSYLDVDDLPAILEFFIENPMQHKAYNIVPNGYVELADIARKVAQIGGVEVKIAADGYGNDYYGDNSRLLAEFPSARFTQIDESIRKLFSYYSKNISAIDKALLFNDK